MYEAISRRRKTRAIKTPRKNHFLRAERDVVGIADSFAPFAAMSSRLTCV
jgi:hypothetical protein